MAELGGSQSGAGWAPSGWVGRAAEAPGRAAAAAGGRRARADMALQFGAAGAAGEQALVGGSFGAADSFPKDFGYGEEEEEAELEGGPGPGGPGGGAGVPGGGAGGADSKPRILLMGLRRSGKSSIQKVRGTGGSSPRLLRCRGAAPLLGSVSLLGQFLLSGVGGRGEVRARGAAP